MVRIIAGELGGRRIGTPSGRRVRPTREAVREAWFSALGPEVAGARVLDLFAGSGALGLEALSRGASHVVFVESDPRVVRVLSRNVKRLGVEDRARVVKRDVADFLAAKPGAEGPERDRRFNLALADPPYGSDWPRRLVRLLARRPFALLLCIEDASRDPLPEEREEGASAAGTEPGIEVVWRREYGDTRLSFYRPGRREGELHRGD